LALHSLVNRFRITDASNQLMLTQYHGGAKPGYCDESSFPPDYIRIHGTAALASQYGLLAHSLPTAPGGDGSCPITDWQALALLYYPTSWQMVQGLTPPLPTTDFSVDGTHVTLTFHSTVYGKNVAWKYYLQRYASGAWHTFAIRGWDPSSRQILQSYTFTPSSSACTRYRVKAINPVNDPVYLGASALANTSPVAFTAAGTGIKPTSTTACLL
jgi:hypothetical protein